MLEKDTEKWAAGKFLSPSYFETTLDMRNLQEQIKKSILLPKIVLTFHCLNKFF